MPSTAQVTIHPSQFPEQVRRDLLASLRTREVNHKFHYDSIKQAQKWLALHEVYSPARTDADVLAIYDQSFHSTVQQITAPKVHVIGLGCGGGQKDVRLLQLLRDAGKKNAYTPSDVSVALTLVARERAISVVEDKNCHPFVCDLATAEDLPSVLNAQIDSASTRLITFFGMIPNFEPQQILPRLAALMRPSDYLLFSANLAPGDDYAEGVKRILPLYDNALTQDWLMTFLTDLGVEQEDGEMRFTIEDDAASGLKRITARFHFNRPRNIRVDGESFSFQPSENIRLFFSYRHTSERIGALLAKYDIKVTEQWISKSEEEGVFLCKRIAGMGNAGS